VRRNFRHAKISSSLPGTAEPNVRVRVRRGIVQIDGERAGIRAVIPVRSPKQRPAGLPQLRSVTAQDYMSSARLVQGFIQTGKCSKGKLRLSNITRSRRSPLHPF
jgi:hypothetical protein